MSRFNCPLKTVPGDMGIDLRRRDVGVTEQRLDTAKIGATFHKMRREGMPEDMGR